MTDGVPSSMAPSGVTKRTEFTLMHIFSPLFSVNKPWNAFFDGGAALQITTIDIDIIAILSPKGGNCFGVPFLKGVDEHLGVISTVVICPL